MRYAGRFTSEHSGRKRLRGALAALLAFGLAVPARADDRCHAALGADAIAIRYAFVRDALRETTRPSRIYYYSWAHGLFGVGAFQIVRGIQVEDPGRKATAAVGAVGALLGFLTLSIRPPPVVAHRSIAPELPEGTLEEQRAQLRRAEDALERTAKQQEFARSWVQYLATTLWGIAKVLTVWLGFDEGLGATQLAIGVVIIGAGRILTHPRGAVDSWRTYRARYPGCEAEAGRKRSLVEVAADPGFVGLRLRF